jgi:hypothetical protein
MRRPAPPRPLPRQHATASASSSSPATARDGTRRPRDAGDENWPRDAGDENWRPVSPALARHRRRHHAPRLPTAGSIHRRHPTAGHRRRSGPSRRGGHEDPIALFYFI